eukprot:7376596-Prymnesium_polylepis.2
MHWDARRRARPAAVAQRLWCSAPPPIAAPPIARNDLRSQRSPHAGRPHPLPGTLRMRARRQSPCPRV